MIDTGSPGSIGEHIAELASESGPYITVYVEVENLEAHLEKASELGGRYWCLLFTCLAKVASFEWFAGPDGNILGIWKPEKS